MGIENEIAFLRRAEEILNREKESDAAKIAELYSVVFDTSESRARFRSPDEWENEELSRAFAFIEEVIVNYVGLFADPRGIPVTYYARQKRLAIRLDAIFSEILRAVVRRSGKDLLVDDRGRPVADRFLDSPILFLKQEARHKHFPKVKKGGGASRRALRERFHSKLAGKGVVPGERGFSSSPITREEAARKKLFESIARRRAEADQ